MKTLIATALIATLPGLAAADAIAPGAAGAIAHFNQSLEGGDRIARVAETDGVTVSSRSGGLGTAFAIFNADADSQDGRRGQQGATLIGGAAVNAQADAIFERLRLESLENE